MKVSLGITQKEMAHRCGWRTQAAFSQYLLGRIPLNLDALIVISNVLKVHPQEISPRLAGRLSIPARAGSTRVGEPLATYGSPSTNQLIVDWETPDDLPSDRGQYVFIAREGMRVSATNGHVVYDQASGPPLVFTTQWIRSKGLHRRNLIVLQTIDDSMEPRIHAGDTLLINRGETDVRDGRVYALRYGQELRVKRLYRRYDGALILRSYNRESYPDETIPVDTPSNLVEIIGRVVWVGGEIDS